MKKTLSLVFAGLIGGAASLGALKVYSDYQQKDVEIVREATPVLQVNQPFVSNASGVDFTKASESTVNSVVHIQTKINGRGSDFGSFHEFFFGNPFGRSRPQIGSGSGVIISQDGYIVTNNHVIEGAQEIEVTLNDRRNYSAKVIGTDPSTDLALIQIDERKLPYIEFANSDNVKVGEWVLAVGNPFNLNSTVTAGIVSAKSRKIDIIHKDLAIESFIQTDAAVNPGNSGGALVNINGELVGINSAIASNTGSYTGYSFAIPSNLVKKVINDLAQFGQVQRAFLGVSIRDIDSKFAKEKGLSQLNGVYVNSITYGGAAEAGGILAGDIILKVNDRLTNTVSELQEQVGMYRPGDKVNILVKRGSKEVNLSVELKGDNGSKRSLAQREAAMTSLGAEFEPVENEKGIKKGLKVVKVGPGKFKSIGIKEGFIILSVNSKEVGDLNDLEKAMMESDGNTVIEGVYPNGMRAYYAFGM